MTRWTDEELLNALRDRLKEDRRAMSDLEIMTRKLEGLNHKLQESEALKGQFLSNIRNEINNPLTAILGLAEQIIDRPEPEMARQFATLIYAEAHRLDFQLQNIFMAAELESGEALPEWRTADIDALVAGLCAALGYRCRERDVRVNRQVKSGLQFVTDARRLGVILANLLANAIEFSPPGSAVGIMAEARDDRLQIVVADAGPGIAPEDQERVFDRFCQLDRGTTKAHLGHGLGLSVSRALAQLLGGTLALESTQGQGCILTLSLPLPATRGEELESAMGGNLFVFAEQESF